MATDQTQLLIGELDGLLEKESRAILGGDLDMIGRLFVTKEQLLNRINDTARPDVAGLPALRTKLMRNQELLASAMRGVKSVVDRFAALRAVREELLTYDASGRKTRHRAARRSSVERRS